MSELYTVFRMSDGESRQENLTLSEAAHAILTHDGCEYDIRPSRDGSGYDLWSRQQVANRPWQQTHWFSVEDDFEAAEIDIYRRVVSDSRLSDWRGGLVATRVR